MVDYHLPPHCWAPLGPAGEVLAYDQPLTSNTVKHRTHSLCRQGCTLCELIPTTPEQRIQLLAE